MKKRSQLPIWVQTNTLTLTLYLLLNLLSAAIQLAALVVGAIFPFLSPLLSLFIVTSVLLSGLACSVLVIGLWQPIGAALEVWRIDGVIGRAKSSERGWRWYSDGWGKWGVGVDWSGFSFDIYTVGGK